MGPRAVRDISTAVRNVNRATGINPFALCNCADLGDSPVNPLDVTDALQRITNFYKEVVQEKNIHPLSVGGDHLVILPVLRALAPKYPAAPLGLIHFDAHSDTWDSYFGDSKYSHGTGVRRAIEEGLVDPKKTVQIGLRGALYTDALDEWYEQLDKYYPTYCSYRIYTHDKTNRFCCLCAGTDALILMMTLTDAGVSSKASRRLTLKTSTSSA
jgi:guanidinopropionase